MHMTGVSNPGPVSVASAMLSGQNAVSTWTEKMVGAIAKRQEPPSVQHDNISTSASRIELSPATVIEAFGRDSLIAQSVEAAKGDRIQIVPPAPTFVDRAAFRARVEQYLAVKHGVDPDFKAAVRNGTLEIVTPGEAPGAQVPPTMSYTIYRAGSDVGGGTVNAPGGTGGGGASGPAAQLGQTSGWLGMRMFFARWPSAH